MKQLVIIGLIAVLLVSGCVAEPEEAAPVELGPRIKPGANFTLPPGEKGILEKVNESKLEIEGVVGYETEGGTQLTEAEKEGFGLEEFCPRFEECNFGEMVINLNTCTVSEDISDWYIIQISEWRNDCHPGMVEKGENANYLYCTFQLGKKDPRDDGGEILAGSVVVSIRAVYDAEGTLLENACNYTRDIKTFLGDDVSKYWIEQKYKPVEYVLIPPEGGGNPIIEGDLPHIEPLERCESYNFFDVRREAGDITIRAGCDIWVNEYIYNESVLVQEVNEVKNWTLENPEMAMMAIRLLSKEYIASLINRGAYKDVVLNIPQW